MPPTFLDLWEVLRIHKDQIERYGGEPGIRDSASLASAVAVARAGTDEGYLHDDMFEMAAAYLWHIVRNHPFVDGNKRTGAVTAVVFLLLNEIRVEASEEDLEALVRDVARGRIGKSEIASFLRQRSRQP
jgi:death-on-curing protein